MDCIEKHYLIYLLTKYCDMYFDKYCTGATGCPFYHSKKKCALKEVMETIYDEESL